jgi:predicted O-methyltransferase YrrM
MELKEFLHKEHARHTEQHPPIRLKKFDRTYLPQLLAKFNMTKGVEIGVEAGKFAEYICQTIPNIEYYGVDTWSVGEDKQSQRRGQERADSFYEQAKQRVAPFNGTLIRGKSMDVVRDFEYESLDWVYIDGCHDFDFVAQDIIEWAKRVKKGGLIAGHDYYKFRNAGVIEAVDAYIKCHRIHDVFLTNEQEASWFFCKP